MYRHQCISLLPTCFHLKCSPKSTRREKEHHLRPLCKSCHRDGVDEKGNSSMYSFGALLAVLRHLPPSRVLLYSLLSFAICTRRKNLESPLAIHYSFGIQFSSPTGAFLEQRWTQVLYPTAAQVTCSWVPLKSRNR